MLLSTAFVVLCAVLLLAAPGAARAHPLEPIQSLARGVGALDVIGGAEAVAVSPDGLHVYAVGRESDTLVAADASTLAPLDVERDGVAGVDGLADASDVAVSPDGAHVYAAGGGDGAIAVFARDGATGALTFVASVSTGLPISASFGDEIALGPDGAHLYVAGQGVASFARDAATGALAPLGLLDAPVPVGRLLAIAPDGAHVYAVSEGTIAVLDRDAASGQLAFGSALPGPVYDVPPGGGLSAYAISPDGAHLYATVSWWVPGGAFGAYYGGAVVALARDAGTGALTIVGTVDQDTDAPAGLPDLADARAVAVGPDGAHVYVASAASDAITRFARDTASGVLTTVASTVDRVDGVAGLDGAADLAIAPDGARVYAAASVDDALAAFDRDPGTGALAFAASFDDRGARGLVGGRSLAVSPDGRFVYVSGEPFFPNQVEPFPQSTAPPASIAIFARDGRTGLVSAAGEWEAIPVAAAELAATAQHLFALVDTDLLCFARDPATGALALEQTFEDAASDLVATADGRDLYAASPDGLALQHFHRPSPGQGLAFVGSYGAETEIASGRAAALDRIGTRLYALGDLGGEQSLVTLERDPASGALAFLGESDFDLLPQDLANLVPRPTWVYAATAQSAVMHARDPVTGLTSFTFALRNVLTDTLGVHPYFSRIEVLPDESTLYFAGGYSDGGVEPGFVEVYAADPVARVFQFEETEPVGVRDAQGIALSPDGRHLYAAAGWSDTLEVYATPEPGAGAALLAAAGALAVLARRV